MKTLLRGFLFGIGISCGVMTGVLLAVTISGNVNVFATGGVVSSSEINENFSSLKTAIETIPLGTYCGRTGATYNGAGVGGYTGAKALCETACNNTNAHMCTPHEISLSKQLGVAITTGSDLWMSTFMAATNISDLVGDCSGWQNSGATNHGAIHAMSGLPSKSACSTSLPIACCL